MKAVGIFLKQCSKALLLLYYDLIFPIVQTLKDNVRLFTFSKAKFRQKYKTPGLGKFISFFYKVYSSCQSIPGIIQLTL